MPRHENHDLKGTYKNREGKEIRTGFSYTYPTLFDMQPYQDSDPRAYLRGYSERRLKRSQRIIIYSHGLKAVLLKSHLLGLCVKYSFPRRYCVRVKKASRVYKLIQRRIIYPALIIITLISVTGFFRFTLDD